MAEFEPGDKVRLVKLDLTDKIGYYEDDTKYLNKTGTIISVSAIRCPYAESLCCVTFDDGYTKLFKESWLVRVTSRPKSEYRHKLVCVESPTSCYFTVGKVYLFDKGILNDNTNVKWNSQRLETDNLTYAQNVEDINKYFQCLGVSCDLKFIEYVE